MKKSLRILVVLSIAASSILFATPANAAVNDLTNISASDAVALLTEGNENITVIPGTEVAYGSVKSYTSISLNNSPGFEMLDPGVLLNSHSLAPYGANNSNNPAPLALRNQLNSILSTAGIEEVVTTNVSALSFDFRTANPSIEVDFLFASMENYISQWDIAAVIVDGVNYAYLSNGNIIRVRPDSNLCNFFPVGYMDAPIYQGPACADVIRNQNGYTGFYYVSNTFNSINGQVAAAAPAARIVGLLDPNLEQHNITFAVADTTDQIIASYLMFSLVRGSIQTFGGIFIPDFVAPDAPTSIVATPTGATTANVSFTAPTTGDFLGITSYTATSSPGGITGTLEQSGSGTISMTGLQPGTSYTFTVKATNSIGDSVASSASNSITTIGVPSAPTSLVAKVTSKRSALVTLTNTAYNGGSAITSYTITSSSDGITKKFVLSGPQTISYEFLNLTPGTSYTFSATATNAIGASAATTSSQVKLEALIEASISSLTYTDDGTGKAGKLAWAGNYIDLVRFTGDKSSYPYPFNYSAFTPTYDGTSSTWNGSLVNLIPGTKYSATIYALSSDGVGESKTIEFTTTPEPIRTAPAKVKSVAAKATGKRSATVSFATPEDDGNSPITSYKVVASPGNKSQKLSQASGASVTFSDLEPGTDYTFTVTATNKIGSSLPVLSNSVTTTALVIPSIDAITYTDDGTGTGGTIKWTGKNIVLVKFLGSADSYPVNLAYGEYSTNWNGRVRNLTPETELTFSISAISEDGVQITKSITFKTGSSLLNKITDVMFKAALFKAVSQSDEIIVANQIPTIYSLIDLNATFEGESAKIKSLLDKFNNTKVDKRKAYLRLPSARPLHEKATSQSPQVCVVENQNTIRSIAPGYCVIAFTVTGLSQEPATLVKGFEFFKYAKL